MALQNTSNTGTRSFDKELNKDVKSFQLPANSWTHARNAINNSVTGDLGKLGNEPSNLLCTKVLYEIIGVVHITEDKWLIYSTDEVDSEIGIFDESDCSYVRLVNDPCLNFSRHNLVVGVCRATSTCTYRAYWDDGSRNISRTMEFSIDPIETNLYSNPNSPIPWLPSDNCTPEPCFVCDNSPHLNCAALRLAPYIQIPCVEVTKGITAGTLLNGSYFVAVAYGIEGQKIGDWYCSNVQSIFEHANSSGSIDVNLDNVDTTFHEILVVIVSIVNQQAVARLAGTYSTHQVKLSFDLIDNTWITIPIETIPLMTPIIERSNAMYAVNNYLLRCGPSSREDFNYQPLANQILTKWVSVEYPADYYVKGGNKTNYLRDEVYAFFIRWVYDTGDKSSSYHIPGRPAALHGIYWEDALGYAYDDSIPTDEFYYQAYNTARVLNEYNIQPYTYLPDGGRRVADGPMGFWESSEWYPDDKPQIWNSHNNPVAGFNTPVSLYVNYDLTLHQSLACLDLCGKHIRHHRFPENCTGKNGSTEYTDATGEHIRILGVEFENIKRPMMNDGITPIPGIVGYEILRGSRNGNKTILAKGIINNMTEYTMPGIVGLPDNPVTGLIPNFPYNDLHSNNFLVKTKMDSLDDTGYLWDRPRKNLFTFHSPETNFTNPYLSAHELKIYGEYSGNVTGKFELSEKHPKEKLISDFTLFVASIVGIGAMLTAMHGKKTTKKKPPEKSVSAVGPVSPSPLNAAGFSGSYTPTIALYTAYQSSLGAQLLAIPLLGGSERGPGDLNWTSIQALYLVAGEFGQPAEPAVDLELTDWARTPQIPFRVLSSMVTMSGYYVEGTDVFLRLILATLKYRDFALRYHSHCFYNNYSCPVTGNRRRVIANQEYIGPQITNFMGSIQNYKINNLYRVRTVALEVRTTELTPGGSVIGIASIHDPYYTEECTRIPASSVNSLYDDGKLKDPTQHSFDSTDSYGGVFGDVQQAASHYVGLKQRIRNQYGQINGVKQLPASTCVQQDPKFDLMDNVWKTARSEVIFGGDTYVGRYTEKNTFFFFYDWLYGQPDGAQLDYLKYRMVPWPTWWANFEGFQANDFTESIGSGFTNMFNPGSTGGFVHPSSFHHLDGNTDNGGNLTNIRFAVKFAWFYLFSSGVRDFYVESEINVAQRDWGELEEQQFYNPYGSTIDTNSLFRTDLIKIGNYYKYDQSLSYSKLFLNYVSWASSQKNTYDPYIAETCFTYYPKRLIYSLTMLDEAVRDNWRIFLPNNYKDFLSVVSCIKSIDKSGAIIFFNDLSPVRFPGVDQLQTTGGTKLTIGDGGLFSQPLQNIAVADKSYEFGSCQNRLSVINTPGGIFWMCQNQGKVYHYGGQMDEISMQDIKWWFATYLPYVLTQDPMFDLTPFALQDNPVAGIGCQSIYDNENGLVYFCKKDYKLKESARGIVTYDHTRVTPEADSFIKGSGATFWINNATSFELGDEVSQLYFDDASWTISYDPKVKSWISWHDWHPNLLMPGKNTFMSVMNNGIWIHNEVCDSYCNYYGKDYPFEIEYMVSTQQSVTSLRSIEYMMEVYKYAENCFDRFHVLDFNFDECVIYNTEQVSGLLKVHMTPKNQPWEALQYPKINLSNIDILSSKVEQKYRLNQFWDITADRGEYNSMAERVIWNTAPNGYIRTLNPNNLNYNKESFQRKKFRHYLSYVLLRRTISGNRKMLLILTNNKNLLSPR